jgi:hypothetical protein
VTRRLAALALAALAAVVHFAFTVPTRREVAMTVDAYGRARVDRHAAAGRLAALERRRDARAKAVSAANAAADPAATTRAVRLAVSRVLETSGAGGVHLGIRPGPEGADVAVTARGSADDVVRLAGDLARPEVGVVLGLVQMTRSADLVGVQIQGRGVARP